MQIKGRVSEVTPIETVGAGTQKRYVVIDTGDQYNPKVAVAFVGKSIDKANGIIVGQEVTIDCNVGSREWNGKWFTEVSGWKVSTGSSSELP